MNTLPKLLHKTFFGLDEKWQCPKEAQFEPNEWILLIPIYYADEECLSMQRTEGSTELDPPKITYTLDYKLIRKTEDVRFAHGAVHVSKSFADTMRFLDVQGWKSTPVLHGSPNAVHGIPLYEIIEDGKLGTIDDVARIIPSANQADSPLFLVENWASNNAPTWRGIVIHVSFLKAFEELHHRPLCCGYSRVLVHPSKTKSHTRSPSHFHYVTSPSQDVPTIDSLIMRITQTAEQFDHFLPRKEETEENIRTLLHEAARIRNASLVPELAILLSQWSGASLFGGAIGFFSPLPRSGDTSLKGRHAQYGCSDNLLSAQRRSSHDEWDLFDRRGWFFFGWRTEEMPGIWAMSPKNKVHLLTSGKLILGPGTDFTTWLFDQLNDLEYASTTRAYPAVKWLGE